MLVAERPVAACPTPVTDRSHRAGKPALGRHLPNHVFAVPRPSPNMGQAQEVEAGPIRFRMARTPQPLWAEVDEARLVGVEGKSIPRETLAQDRQHTFGVDDVIERHQCIVGEPGKGALPSETRFHLDLEPFVQHVVQEDVREAGRDYTPLRGALYRVVQETVLNRPPPSAIYRSSFG
jgi:hypothetical protein